MISKQFSIVKALRFAFDSIRIPLLFLSALAIVFLFFGPFLLGVVSPVYLFIVACFIVAIGIVYFVGLINIGLRVIDNKSVSIADFYSGYPFFRTIGTFIWTMLVAFIGMLLFIVPGLVWSSRYMFASFLTLDKNLSIEDSMKASSVVTYTAKVKLLFTPLLIQMALAFFMLIAMLFMALPVALGMFYLRTLFSSHIAEFIYGTVLFSLMVSVQIFIWSVFTLTFAHIYRQLLTQTAKEDFEAVGINLDMFDSQE